MLAAHFGLRSSSALRRTPGATASVALALFSTVTLVEPRRPHSKATHPLHLLRRQNDRALQAASSISPSSNPGVTSPGGVPMSLCSCGCPHPTRPTLDVPSMAFTTTPERLCGNNSPSTPQSEALGKEELMSFVSGRLVQSVQREQPPRGSGIQPLLDYNKHWAGEIALLNPDYFGQLAKQQRPQYLWIGCSDSRVPANEIVGLYPGDIFVHRNIANIVCNSDLNALAVIQYAIECLKVEHVIISGHYKCGGVTAALHEHRVGLADHWILHVSAVKKRHWRRMLADLPSRNHLDALCELNVLAQVEHVVETHLVQGVWTRQNIEDSTAKREGRPSQNKPEDEVEIHGWVYGLEDGLIRPLLTLNRRSNAEKEIQEAADAVFWRYGQHHTVIPMKGIGRQSFLVVFDFDHTVVNCNTDVVIPTALGRGDMQTRMMAEEHRMQWTNLMDTVIAPFSKDELIKAAQDSVTIDPRMPEVFAYLIESQKQYTVAAPGRNATDDARAAVVEANVPLFVEMHIASDSNQLFIDASLDARFLGVKEHISQIHSNPYYDLTAPGTSQDAGVSICHGPDQPGGSSNASDEAERCARYNPGMARKSRVCWYEPHGHRCPCCLVSGKPNMCKSLIIERLLQTTSLIDPTIIFVGDGANDYCPVLNVLRPRDYMFARRDYPLHHILAGQLPLASGEKGGAGVVGGCCRIGLWGDAAELKELFQVCVGGPGARLPTLVRFRDASAKEFRSVTMAKRIPSVLKRTLEESGNVAATSEKGRRRVMELIRNAEANDLVPPLPGQACVPAWLRNYAYVSEYDNVHANDVSRRVSPATAEGAVQWIAPRWGQVPWLHGEIYFYHLLWQYLMMRDTADEGATADEGTPFTFNIITQHAMHNPLLSGECDITSTPCVISPPAVAMQGERDVAALVCRPAIMADSIVARRVHPGCDGPAPLVPYAEMVRQPSGSVIPPAALFFSEYRDIFSREKRDVLMNFLNVRIVPMLACQPWDADRDYGGILLRWMLWGNGIDLSMFTLDQLTSSQGEVAGGGGASHGCEVAPLREAERAASLAQDSNLVGNEVAMVEDHLRLLLDPNNAGNGSRQIDVVMDNVGVECLSDLCFGLWYINQVARLGTATTAGGARVVFHVKPMPYYVSDVTPHDFDLTLAMLEGAYTDETFEPDAAKRATLKAVLEPFIAQVQDCFASGAFALDADTVWTQPSEYRDLPPRVVNHFFTQRVSASASAGGSGGGGGSTTTTASPVSSATGLYRMNKSHIEARSGLVIFKGDLNYRRLVGDRYWDRSDFLTSLAKEERPDLCKAPESYTVEEQAVVAELTQDTPVDALMDSPTFSEVVSAYWPTQTIPVCSIRTIKSECCVGVPGKVKARLDQQFGLSWRISGKYGEILFAS